MKEDLNFSSLLKDYQNNKITKEEYYDNLLYLEKQHPNDWWNI